MSDITLNTSSSGYDVLLYISDQHTADCAGFMGDQIARTPNLDRIAKKSIIFNNAYTTCPLCVPARASLMTSRIASNIGVFDNSCDYKSSEVTFAHTHALAGYDCNLIGRMHFVGMDFYHGFTRRIGKDMTASYWGYPSEKREDLGDFGRSFYQKHCLEIIGSGDSPVLSYDRDIAALAEQFYSHDYKKPQLTVVGSYAPHFPYVAPEDKMEHYRERLKEQYKDDTMHFNLPPIDAKVQITSKEDIIELRAAYYAMVEIMDEQIGAVYDKYMEYLKRNGRKGIFIYMSDHGDQLGCMGIYGKQTFFEKSARIPLIMQVDDLEGGRKIDEPVSIIDIAPTLCDLNGTEHIPLAEGKSFTDLIYGEKITDRYVISEFYDSQIAPCIRGYMVYKDKYKYIVYHGYENHELLFDLSSEREETNNIAKQNPEKCTELRNILENDWRITDHTKEFLDGKKNHFFLDKVGADQQYLNQFTYIAPETVRRIEDTKKRSRREW